MSAAGPRRPLWSWVCGAGLVFVSLMALLGIPPPEAQPAASALDVVMANLLHPAALFGMACSVLALGAAARRRPRGAFVFAVACLLSFVVSGFAGDRTSPESRSGNLGAVVLLFVPFVLGLWAEYRRSRSRA